MIAGNDLDAGPTVTESGTAGSILAPDEILMPDEIVASYVVAWRF
jgi:hypothetical protein